MLLVSVLLVSVVLLVSPSVLVSVLLVSVLLVSVVLVVSLSVLVSVLLVSVLVVVIAPRFARLLVALRLLQRL